MRQQASTPLPNNEREALEQVIERARGFLGQGVFLQEWIFGNALTQDEAIKLALLEMG
jgi:hypothetical protein